MFNSDIIYKYLVKLNVEQLMLQFKIYRVKLKKETCIRINIRELNRGLSTTSTDYKRCSRF